MESGTTPLPLELRVENLWKSFGDHHVLRGVDFSVGRGELVAIVGESGGGKTVLLEQLIGQMSSDKGRIWLANHETMSRRLWISPGLAMAEWIGFESIGQLYSRVTRCFPARFSRTSHFRCFG
jgi:ABC-type polar amino acid transport system ATPase subunit